MSVEDAPPHLSQEELRSKDKTLLAGLGSWLLYAEFDPKTNKCIDKDLPDAWRRLKEMDFIRKVILT